MKIELNPEEEMNFNKVENTIMYMLDNFTGMVVVSFSNNVGIVSIVTSTESNC